MVKKDIKWEALKTFAETNIKILADNQKTYNRHLETTENVILAFARMFKITPKELAKFVLDTDKNNEYNKELGEALGLFKKDGAVQPPKTTNRKGTKKTSNSI